MSYDAVIVGAGMFGSALARTLTDRGKKVLVVDRRPHIGGMCFTEDLEGVVFHKYGPHVFHTNRDDVWAFVNKFAEFRQFMVRTKAVYQKKIYSLPFNLMFFHQLWGVMTPDEVKKALASVCIPIENPKSIEEWALSRLGPEIYEKFIYHYSKKQWGREPKDLPAAILQRLPIRTTFDDNYFTDRWQGIPTNGYTQMFERMLAGIEVRLGCDFLDDREALEKASGQVVYSGRVDRFFDYRYGALEFRSCRFETKTFDGDYQGNATFHYVGPEHPYTRVVEHKHFERPTALRSPVTWEYPFECGKQDDPLYPVNDLKNNALYEKYRAIPTKVIFAGRLGSFRYFDMCEVITQAWKLAALL